MTIKLKVECVRGMYIEDKCIRVLAMDDEASLLDLHNLIQQAVSFDADHLFRFYIANTPSPWAERQKIIGSEDGDEFDDWDRYTDLLRRKRLSDIWPLGRKKLYYHFDFGDDWVFEIRKLRPSKADASISCPQILERIGPDPEQYPDFDE